jgi:thioredoxin 1
MADHLELTDDNFESEVAGCELPLLVDFGADWCGPCLRLNPMLEELAEQFEGKLQVGKMDIDSNRNTPSQFGVMAVPTLIFFKDGKEVERIVGLLPKGALLNKIQAFLG